MSDYKNTLNLPRTDFPMKASLPQKEPQTLKKWQEMNLYGKMREIKKGAPKYIFHDGPPYANGHMHIGHALNRTLKDIVIKSKNLSGFDAPNVPGWDCHGLPIEVNVEKKHGKPGHKISASEFRKACREYAASQIDIQREELKRLGLDGDWDHPYITMDFAYEANIIRSLAKIVANGHLLKGFKPVHWCLDCGSALAEAEVEYADKTSPSIHVKFRVIDQAAFLQRMPGLSTNTVKEIIIPIWTTTPWTLPANQAVALNPELEYVLVETSLHQAFLICEALHQSVLEKYGITQFRILGKAQGKVFQGLLLQHPFYASRQVPLVTGEHVTIESGTGAVHTAPAHGVDDFAIAKVNQLPLDNPVGDDGVFLSNVEKFAGIHVSKANDLVIEELKKQDALLHLSKITHSYPHCWRHKTALIFRSTPQWFISMDQAGLRKDTMEAIERVEWIPDWGKARIRTMIENRPDWCISRQRTWGVPIPLFTHLETGELHPETISLMAKIADLVEKKGVDAWFDSDAAVFLGEEAKFYRKNTDILDVWFDSGVSHECVLRQRPELGFPADLYLEGSDQHRGWFQSSLLTSVAINRVEPYRQVLTHGYTVDAEGRKMSKSIGNVIAPDKILQSLGADILRLWVSSVDYRAEISLSDEILTRTSETYRRLRNTARFFLANLDGFDPEKDLLSEDKLLALDLWALDKARILQEEVIKAYDTFQFHQIYQKVHHFCAVDMGNFYLDIIKDRQYTMPRNSVGRRSAQTALYHITEAFVRWIAPILCFTADEIWEYLPGKRNESVFLNTWYTQLPALKNTGVYTQAYWNTLRAVRDAVNKEIERLRGLGTIGSALEARVSLVCDPDLKTTLDAIQNELRFVLITSSAKVYEIGKSPFQESDLLATEVPGLALFVETIQDKKCERCWHRTAEVGTDAKHPGLCQRCVENVDGLGEVRLFA